MSGITLSAGVRQNLLSLQQTADMMTSTQNKLSTGKKVNSALDNPTNFFTSSSLSARAGDLSTLMDSMSNGVKTIEAADNGLTSITKTLESMQSTLRQARQDKSFESASYSVTPQNVALASTSKLTLVGGAFGTATPAIDLTTTGAGQKVISNAANYAAPAVAGKAAATGDVNLTTAASLTGGTLKINYGGKSVSATVAGFGAANASHPGDIATAIQQAIDGSELAGKLTATVDSTNFVKIAAVDEENSTITFTGSSGTLAADIMGTAENVSAANLAGSSGKFEFSVNGTAVTLNATSGADLTTALRTINTTLESAGSKFKAAANGTKIQIQGATTDAGALQITGKDADLFSATADVQSVSGTADASLTLLKTVDTLVSEINSGTDTKGLVKASNDNGKLRIQNLSTQDLTVQGVNGSGKITGDSANSSVVDGNSVRSDLAGQYNELRDQLDKLADDASFNGINLLRGDKLTLTFNEGGTSSLSIQSKGGNSVDSQNLKLSTTITAKDLDSDTNIDTQLDKIKSALTSVRSQSSSFGNNLSIVENRQDFTRSMMNTLQIGADQLVLADSNEEGANMLALQTRQQLSTTALSLANQANQAVLRLF